MMGHGGPSSDGMTDDELTGNIASSRTIDGKPAGSRTNEGETSASSKIDGGMHCQQDNWVRGNRP